MPEGGGGEVWEGEAAAGGWRVGVGAEAGEEVAPEVHVPVEVHGSVVVGALEVGGDLGDGGAHDEGDGDEGEGTCGDEAEGGGAAFGG